MLTDSQFWFSVLGLIGIARLIEAVLQHYLSRGDRRPEREMGNLRFMLARMEAMEQEINRQKKDIRSLNDQMRTLKDDHERLNKTLIEVTVTIEDYAPPELVDMVRAIPGVPRVARIDRPV
jgi:flagellar motility protein MotE (MotC chaperone)